MSNSTIKTIEDIAAGIFVEEIAAIEEQPVVAATEVIAIVTAVNQAGKYYGCQVTEARIIGHSN